MKKLLFTLILLSVFPVTTKETCTARYRKDFKTGVTHNHESFLVKDCSCPCTGPRTEKNICLRCGHTHLPKTSTNFVQEIIQDTEDSFDDDYKYIIDLVSTDTHSR